MRDWLMRAAAFLVAWAVVYLCLGAFHSATSWPIEPYGIAWICVGIGLRLQSELIDDWPTLSSPAEAMRFLWRCATWPWHLRA